MRRNLFSLWPLIRTPNMKKAWLVTFCRHSAGFSFLFLFENYAAIKQFCSDGTVELKWP